MLLSFEGFTDLLPATLAVWDALFCTVICDRSSWNLRSSLPPATECHKLCFFCDGSLWEKELLQRQVWVRIMEESLLPSGSSRRRDSKEKTKSSVLGRRVVAITAGDKYQKAAAMVDQVRDEDFRGNCYALSLAESFAGRHWTDELLRQSVLNVRFPLPHVMFVGRRWIGIAVGDLGAVQFRASSQMVLLVHWTWSLVVAGHGSTAVAQLLRGKVASSSCLHKIFFSYHRFSCCSSTKS